MSNLPRFAAGVLLSLTLAGCANADLGPKQTMGTLLGAGTGALIGAQFGHGTGQLVATSVGTLLGAYLGNEAGKSLDRADALYASRAETRRWSTRPRAATSPAQSRQRPLRQRHPDRDVRERRTAVLPRIPAPGADRRPSPGCLRHGVPHPRRSMADGALSTLCKPANCMLIGMPSRVSLAVGVSRSRPRTVRYRALPVSSAWISCAAATVPRLVTAGLKSLS